MKENQGEVDHEEGPSYFYNDRCSILPASSRIAGCHKKDIASQPPFLWHHDRLAVHVPTKALHLGRVPRARV